jgi:LacI family transcriptional regulator
VSVESFFGQTFAQLSLLHLNRQILPLKAVTITDIAKALNISTSTVSRALKGSYKISEETIVRVQEYARAYNYKPNLNAQSLKNKNSRSIGVLVSAVANNFFGEVINGIESVAQIYDYHVIITQNHESVENEIRNLEHLLWRNIDGLLISVSSETADFSHITNAHEQGIPIIFFDRVIEGINTHQVIADNIKGAYDVTKHLLEQGFKNVAMVTSSQHLSITRQRQEGYEKALQEAGVSILEDYIKYCEHGGKNLDEINSAVDELLFSSTPPDAMFTASDRITIGCFSALKKRDIKIPQQIALGGFSNFIAPELFCPSLTTVTQPAFEIGKTAAELLIEMLESKKTVTKFERKVFPTGLSIRESSSGLLQ